MTPFGPISAPGVARPADEVDVRPEHDHAVPVEVEECHGQDRAETDERAERREAFAEEEPHRSRIGCAHRHVEGRSAYRSGAVLSVSFTRQFSARAGLLETVR
jgi:hypothetical protein